MGVLQQMNYMQTVVNITLLEVVDTLIKDGTLPENFNDIIKEKFTKFQEEK